MRLRFLALAMSLALAPTLGVSAGDLPTLYSPKPKVQFDALALQTAGRFTVLPLKNFNAEATGAQATAATTVPLWSRTVSAGGAKYKYTMVGINPFVANTAATSLINAQVIPIQFVFNSFGAYVADPTAADPTCSPAGTAQALTDASPIFNAIPGKIWGTSVGTGQYVDLFQRANFYTQTKPTGVNPNYHVTLVNQPPIAAIQVPVTGGDVVAGTCGNIGLLDIASWDNFIQTSLMPLLAAQNPPIAPPTSLAVFLLYNVVLFEGSTSNCCILGYHSAFNDPAYGGAFHTYVSVEFDTNKSFTGVADISAMSHEVAEWMDDPSGANPTPSWGNIGQVSGCQANLEVGDPLSGTLDQIYMSANKYTYHVQDLTFTSWFYGQHPSTGVNGWYSFLGTFLGPAAPC
jgi:hypothetical protein